MTALRLEVFSGDRDLPLAGELHQCRNVSHGEMWRPVGEPDVFAVPAALNGDSEWVCQADSDRERGWYMRCENLTEALADDPVQKTTDDAPSRLIALYGAPYADSKLTQLASAVLCGRKPRCRILMVAN